MPESPPIALVFALYIEAKPFIDSLGLKNWPAPKGLQIFGNDYYAAVITGTGKVASAIGTTYLLSQFSSVVCVVNIGICGSSRAPGGALFLIEKITDAESGRNFYPDLLVKTDLPVNILQTVSKPFIGKSDYLVDMEGSGFYEAASNFLDAHQIQLLKIVSDHMDTPILNKKSVQKCIDTNLESILSYVPKAAEVSDKISAGSGFEPEEKQAIERLWQEHYFTVTEEHQALQLLWNLKVQSGQKVPEILSGLTLPADKKYSKKQSARVLLLQMEQLLQVF